VREPKGFKDSALRHNSYVLIYFFVGFLILFHFFDIVFLLDLPLFYLISSFGSTALSAVPRRPAAGVRMMGTS
jgi:hypothetical protein